MISVIVYGRNDSHGYNLHRRVALGLNCIAQVLTDPDDEIIFVDYNTPDELPTLIEALSDTLTDAALGLLRVLRVPAAVHRERFEGRTHLAVSEPLARNVGARRSNPANRWLLSTNTDMIFLALSNPDESLSEICGGLDDFFYGLPRFELPEWLWEKLPRSDPVEAMDEIGRLGPVLGLDEPTISYGWARFDAPGDFQLMLRDDLIGIDGFDEAMLHGYHVDSNLSRRMFILRGGVESLEQRIAGYHCNHLRTPTALDLRTATRDLDQFCFGVEEAELPGQRETWGLRGAVIREVSVQRSVAIRVAGALSAAFLPNGPGSRGSSDVSRLTGNELAYDSIHVLPFVADALAVSPPDVTVGYVGANAVLRRLLQSLVVGLGFERPLLVPDPRVQSAIADLERRADLFVIDLGVDSAAALIQDGDARMQLPSGLGPVFIAFDQLIDFDRARVQQGAHPRRFVLVNSATSPFDEYVMAQMERRNTTFNCRVRQVTVKPDPGGDLSTIIEARHRIRWIARNDPEPGHLHLPPNEAVDLSTLRSFRGFGGGWAAFPEQTGIWTQGERADLALAFEATSNNRYRLSLSIGSICVAFGDTLDTRLLLDGVHAASRRWARGEPDPMWRLDLPAEIVTDGKADLTLLVQDPRLPAEIGWPPDERRVGLLISEIKLETMSMD